jgi:hypothetical protein
MYEKINRSYVDRSMRGLKEVVKKLAKDCVAVSFRMEKGMINQAELENIEN